MHATFVDDLDVRVEEIADREIEPAERGPTRLGCGK